MDAANGPAVITANSLRESVFTSLSVCVALAKSVKRETNDGASDPGVMCFFNINGLPLGPRRLNGLSLGLHSGLMTNCLTITRDDDGDGKKIIGHRTLTATSDLSNELVACLYGYR